MPARRHVCRRRLVYAALLIAAAVLSNVVHVCEGIAYHPSHDVVYLPTPERNYPCVNVHFLDRVWFYVKAPSEERARGIAYRWERYRPLWWIPAAIATCIVSRELLPISRFFGADDDERGD
jgi:hypothetical protein